MHGVSAGSHLRSESAIFPSAYGELGLFSLAGRGDDRLGVMGVLGVLAEMSLDGLQDRGVRQRFDP